jgi:hypothetical protein
MEQEIFTLYCHAVQQYELSSFCHGIYTVRSKTFFRHFEMANELPECLPKAGKYSKEQLVELKYLPARIKKELSK